MDNEKLLASLTEIMDTRFESLESKIELHNMNNQLLFERHNEEMQLYIVPVEEIYKIKQTMSTLKSLFAESKGKMARLENTVEKIQEETNKGRAEILSLRIINLACDMTSTIYSVQDVEKILGAMDEHINLLFVPAANRLN